MNIGPHLAICLHLDNCICVVHQGRYDTKTKIIQFSLFIWGMRWLIKSGFAFQLFLWVNNPAIGKGQ